MPDHFNIIECFVAASPQTKSVTDKDLFGPLAYHIFFDQLDGVDNRTIEKGAPESTIAIRFDRFAERSLSIQACMVKHLTRQQHRLQNQILTAQGKIWTK